MSDDDRKLHELIHNEIDLDRGRKEAFTNVASALDIDGALSPRLIDRWFQWADVSNLDKVPEQWRKLIDEICKMYKESRNGVETRKCPHLDWCQLRLLSTRYSMDFKMVGEILELYIFDNFYGRKSFLHIDSSLLPSSPSFHCFALDFPHFLLISTWDDEDDEETEFSLHLMQIDLSSMTAKLLDSKKLTGYFQYFIVDCGDRRRFVLYVQGLESKYLQQCEAIAGKLEMETQVLDDEGDVGGLFLRYQANKLFAVEIDTNNDEPRPLFPFTEWTLSPSGLRRRHVCNIRMEDQFDPNDYFFNQEHVWLQDTCYSLLRYSVGQTWMYKFDLKNKEVEKMQELSIDFMCNLFMDTSTLTVCTKSQKRNEHKWHRFVFGNQPDTLLNITLKWIAQNTVHLEEQKFQSFIEQLPNSVRPFGRF